MYVRHLKNIDNVGICSCMWVNWMRQQSVRSPWDWGLWFWGGETWCGVSTGGAAEERGYLREVWEGNEKKRKHGFLICSFSWLIYTSIQYQCQLLLRILAGLSWFACEIVLVIFTLISYLSDQTLYQYLVQAVQMMYLNCCHCSSTDSKHNHFQVPWECVECNYNSFMILMIF